METIGITINGKVQGVFFRKNTKLIADRFGIVGYVCNKSGGEVYIQAQGSVDALEKLIAWCKVGPEDAVVESVIVDKIEINKFFKSFNIVYECK